MRFLPVSKDLLDTDSIRNNPTSMGDTSAKALPLKKSSCIFPLGKMSALLSNQTLGCRGATALQGEMLPLCCTQQGPIYLAELGYPLPDPDSINLGAAAAGGKVGFVLTTYLLVQLEIWEQYHCKHYSSGSRIGAKLCAANSWAIQTWSLLSQDYYKLISLRDQFRLF